MGTFNLLARDLQVPLELEQAVPALAGGPMQQVDTAEVKREALFSVREQAELLGGRMDVHSAPGEGTRASVTRPT